MNEEFDNDHDSIVVDCEKHGRSVNHRRGDDEFSLPPHPGCQHCAKEQAAERRRREALEQHRDKMRETGLPGRFLGSHFSTYKQDEKWQKQAHDECIAFAKDFQAASRRGATLVLVGPTGTGKTHLIASILATVAWYFQGIPAYTTARRLALAVKATYNRESRNTEEYLVHQYAQSNLLAIDEIGAGSGTPTERLIVSDILAERYDAVRPTILATNCTPDELREVLGDRIIDRIRECAGAWVVLDGKSYRPEVAKRWQELAKGDAR